MKVFVVYAHVEPRSFNGALFQMARETLRAAGHTGIIEERQTGLKNWAARLRAIESEAPIEVGEY